MTLIAIRNICDFGTKIHITDKGNFKRIRVSDTYDQFGQPVGRDNAGDHLVITSDKLINKLNKFLEEQEDESRYDTDEVISFFDHYDAANFVTENGEEGKDYEYFASECLAYNYWNGNNWQSVVLESDDYDTEWEFVDNSEEIIEDYQNKEYISESFGCKKYEGKKYIFIESHWQNSWELAYIESEIDNED